MQETRVQSLGWEDPLEKGKATHSSTLAWRIPWTEEPNRLQSTGSQKVGHNWETNTAAAAASSKLLQSCLTLSKISVVPKLRREIRMNSPLLQGTGDLAVSQEFILKYQLLQKEWGGVRLLATQKPRDKSGRWKRKFALFQMLATGVGGWQTSVQRPTFPQLASRVTRAFIDRRRGLLAEIASQLWQSSSNWLSVVWPASSWLFKVQLIFSSRICLFTLLEASSQNCGSLCHGYSLVIM